MSPGRIVLLMVVFVVIGLPMVAYLWETINQILALELDPVRIAVSVPLLAIFLGFLAVIGRRINRWHALHQQG